MSNKSLDLISDFIFTSKYSRYDENLNRRESWDETISRLERMHLEKYSFLNKEDKSKIKWAFDLVRQKRIVPSMRALQFGGKAILAHQARQFNCAVRHVDSLRSFAEIFYLLLCGCGVGIGLSKRFLSRLPNLVDASDKTGTIMSYVVEDTIEGWSDSVEALLNCYFKNTPYTGRKIVFDYSRIRKKGAILKTGGGKAPGYKGLKESHKKIKALLDHVIEYHNQDRLKTINAYDILMHCADAVLSGGIRRSATSIIFEINDDDMVNAKVNITVDKVYSFDEVGEETVGGRINKIYEGKVEYEGVKYDLRVKGYELDSIKKKNVSWVHLFPHRARSNNSVLINRKTVTFEEFNSIVQRTKEFGEPGFVFSNDDRTLFNPCFEIAFIPVTEDGVCGVQFCNLTSMNGRLASSLTEFKENVEAYTIIGTLQAGYTDFKYLSPAAKKLTEEEALLGCSITGMMDNSDVLLSESNQLSMSNYAKLVNEEWAKKIRINPAARITAIKPEGTSSLLLGCASGIHPHHARRYFRRVQCNKLDPVYKFFKKYNPHMCEPSVWSANKTDDVITFPIEVSNKVMVKSDLTAIEHLNIIKNTQKNWVINGTTKYNKKDITNNVSCTVVVDDNEWDDIIKYLYLNREYFAAVSLLPKMGDKLYAQAPMEAVTTEDDEKIWDNIVSNLKSVDYSKLKEDEDNTNVRSEVACAGGACELVFT